MIRYILLPAIITAVIFMPWQPLYPGSSNFQKSRYAKDHIIVKLKKGPEIIAASGDLITVYNEIRIKDITSSLNLKYKHTKKLFPENKKSRNNLYSVYELGTYYLVYFDNEIDPAETASEFENSEYVDFSEPDFIGEAAGKRGNIIPNDTYFNKQWALNNNGSMRTTTGRPGKFRADMNVLKGWEVESGSKDIIVAILDSGVKLDHPDLSGRIWVNSDELKNGIDDDGNGYTDDINGYNFAYDNSNIHDDGGHGTNIAGTIGAATNNGIGFAGLDQNCRLMICKNLDDENLGEYSWWATSLYYAVDNGANIINMSEGGYDYSKTLSAAIKYAYESGALILASMMNKNNSDTYYPASFPEVLAVGATDTDDNRCREFTWGGGSNWGKHISVVAPGNKIYGLDYKDNYNYDIYWSGTSQATAYVSAIASILLGQDQSRKNTDLKTIINSTAVDQVGDSREDTPGWDQFYGFGRVDLYAALTFGNFPSGNKNEKPPRNYDSNYKNNDATQNDDDKRARAIDYYDESRDRDNKEPDDNDKRAKKYEPYK